mmetsp:Transcript_6444/g.8152  ORF Transcript_6444/g.8152 Transcript_6444/m.8152 type:complete len:84 (-) Transcript_6444:651-902(-)
MKQKSIQETTRSVIHKTLFVQYGNRNPHNVLRLCDHPRELASSKLKSLVSSSMLDAISGVDSVSVPSDDTFVVFSFCADFCCS